MLIFKMLCSKISCFRQVSTLPPFSLSSITSPISVKTCTEIYPHLLKTSPVSYLYRKTSPTGFDLCTTYADSSLASDDLSKFDRTVVAVHGVYGYYSHFERLFKHFYGSKVRVVALNMPDFQHTLKHGYWHSTAENGTFLTDFLLKLNIHKIDCLVTHSSGILTTSDLWGKANGPISISSIALFSPQTRWIDSNKKNSKMRHAFLIRHPLWYKLLELLRVHQSRYWPMAYGSMNDFLTTAVLFLDPTETDKLYPKVDYLVNQTQTPVSILKGAKDTLIYPKSNAEVHRRLGISMADVVHINPDEDQFESTMKKTGKRMNSYSMETSGHFAHQKNAKYANRVVENLLY